MQIPFVIKISMQYLQNIHYNNVTEEIIKEIPNIF